MPNHVRLIFTLHTREGLIRATAEAQRTYAGFIHARLLEPGISSKGVLAAWQWTKAVWGRASVSGPQAGSGLVYPQAGGLALVGRSCQVRHGEGQQYDGYRSRRHPAKRCPQSKTRAIHRGAARFEKPQLRRRWCTVRTRNAHFIRIMFGMTVIPNMIQMPQTEKYLAWGWWTTMALVDCSGWSWSSSAISMPMRSAPSNASSLCWSARLGQAG